MSAIAIYQVGFSTAAGNVNNLLDGDPTNGWTPVSDGLDAYPNPPVNPNGMLVPGSYPAIQFDFGVAVRIPQFNIKTETASSIGQCYLVASENTMTSPDDSIQLNDRLAGGPYSITELNSGQPINTLAIHQPIIAQYWRFVFWRQPIG
jgi:hypothetical protein